MLKLFRRVASALALTICLFAVSGQQATAQPLPPPAPAATIELRGFKGGYIFGVTAYEGFLFFNGQAYPVDFAGVSFGLTIGGTASDLVGEVYNIYSPFDIEGTYGATTSSYAVAGGNAGVVLSNSRGVEIHLRGAQMGLEFSLDVSGVYVTLR